MRVYIGKFRYYYDGGVEVVVATSQERVEQELARLMTDYIEPLKQELGHPIPTSYRDLHHLGLNHEWFSVDWSIEKVHSDGHILKYVMEEI